MTYSSNNSYLEYTVLGLWDNFMNETDKNLSIQREQNKEKGNLLVTVWNLFETEAEPCHQKSMTSWPLWSEIKDLEKSEDIITSKEPSLGNLN